jgi:hypothetical protein
MKDTTGFALCLIIGLVFLSFVLVIAWIRLERSRCPECRRFGARQDLGKELLGISKQTRRFWSSLNNVPLGRIVPHKKYGFITVASIADTNGYLTNRAGFEGD